MKLFFIPIARMWTFVHSIMSSSLYSITFSRKWIHYLPLSYSLKLIYFSIHFPLRRFCCHTRLIKWRFHFEGKLIKQLLVYSLCLIQLNKLPLRAQRFGITIGIERNMNCNQNFKLQSLFLIDSAVYEALRIWFQTNIILVNN